MASRFEEVQVELAVWKKQSAAQVELAEMDVERAEAERDQAKEAEARSFANSANATAALVRAVADLERAEAEMTLSEDEALALFAWFDHVGVPYVPAMSAFRRDLDVVEAKIRAFLALAEARERGEGLSREEIEALLATLEFFEESDVEVFESARAKLRAWLGQQDDV